MHTKTKIRITKEYFINQDKQPACDMTLEIAADEDNNLPLYLRSNGPSISECLVEKWGIYDPQLRTRSIKETYTKDTFNALVDFCNQMANTWIDILKAAADEYDALWAAVPDTQHENYYI